MKTHIKIVTSLMLAALSTVASCGQSDAPSAAEPAKAIAGSPSLDDVKVSITAGLKQARPNISVEAVEALPFPGLYKVLFKDAKEIYASADGKYFVTGDVFEVKNGNIVNLTEFSRNKDRAKAIASIDKKDLITFSPKGEVKQKMYVFTDIDCGYCQLLHSKMAEYNEMGIEVSYLGYPRAGVNSNSFKKLASAWCDANPQDALTKLKQKQQIPENVCAGNPIAEQYDIGRKIGLTGTPAIVLEDGELISGYLPPEKMKQRFNL